MNSNTLYRPLSAAREEVRILEVDLVLRRGLVSCNLRCIALGEEPACPSFDAVSWCWGNPKHRKSIIVDGQEVEVPQNAEEVLR